MNRTGRDTNSNSTIEYHGWPKTRISGSQRCELTTPRLNNSGSSKTAGKIPLLGPIFSLATLRVRYCCLHQTLLDTIPQSVMKASLKAFLLFTATIWLVLSSRTPLAHSLVSRGKWSHCVYRSSTRDTSHVFFIYKIWYNLVNIAVTTSLIALSLHPSPVASSILTPLKALLQILEDTSYLPVGSRSNI